ncbi:hypothetical protein [Helicobacter marmotae]|uniref:Uncharacterized protein n=1 Tax=Helicobacter marmotae TaxID=152490 RepID=A0A3D8I245_9HELI|nr:hypothetical protein [Helicobacter marmotae]RDU59056.1 hypothetical protein CQA63_08315 [Helicobacter marmotae]
MEIRDILMQHGVQTRIVPCELEIAFCALNAENEQACKKEYLSLSQHRYGSIAQWLNKNKSRIEDTDEVLLELLMELYHKVEHIEQILLDKGTQYLPLPAEGVADFVGHGVVCMPQDVFENGQKYYLRIFLPIFPQRYIGVFAHAISPKIVLFRQIHHKDQVDFDSFVVQMERVMILDSKTSIKE